MSWLRKRLAGRAGESEVATADGFAAASGAPEASPPEDAQAVSAVADPLQPDTTIARWPFWAPTPDASVEIALDMAGLKPGEHLLDLGCGDGRVLEAAVKRGATALGYEADAQRASVARQRLAALNGAARVEVADFHTAPMAADVVFAFLSPATLFRLRHRFAAMPAGTRIISYAYGFVGWTPDKHSEGCFLYTMPPKPVARDFREGWEVAGLVVGGPPDRTVLVAFPFGARAGEVEIEVSSSLRSFSQVYLGALSCDVDTNIPVDIRVTTGTEGSVKVGGIRVQGHEFLVVVVAAGDQMQRRAVKPQDLDALRQALTDVKAGKREPASLLVEPESTPA